MSPEIVLRAMEPEDINFIHSSWLRSLRNDSPLNSKIPTGIWNEGKSPLIKKLLHSGTTVVATLPEDRTHLVGFICFEMFGEVPILHYVLVKKIYAGFGFSRVLMNAFLKSSDSRSIILSHLSQDFIRRYFNTADNNRLFVYNPFILEDDYGSFKTREASECGKGRSKGREFSY